MSVLLGRPMGRRNGIIRRRDAAIRRSPMSLAMGMDVVGTNNQGVGGGYTKAATGSLLRVSGDSIENNGHQYNVSNGPYNNSNYRNLGITPLSIALNPNARLINFYDASLANSFVAPDAGGTYHPGGTIPGYSTGTLNGNSGATADQLLAEFPAIAGRTPAAAVDEQEIGINQAFDPLMVTGSYTSMLTIMRGYAAAKRPVILRTLLARGSAAGAGWRTNVLNVNIQIKALENRAQGIFVFDAWKAANDQALANGGADGYLMNPLQTNDDIHPTTFCAMGVAKALAAFRDLVFTPGNDLLSRLWPNTNILGTRGIYAKAGGTGSGTAGTGVTGEVPDGYTIQRSTGSLATAVASMVANAETGGYSVQLVISPNGSTAIESFEIVPTGLSITSTVANLWGQAFWENTFVTASPNWVGSSARLAPHPSDANKYTGAYRSDVSSRTPIGAEGNVKFWPFTPEYNFDGVATGIRPQNRVYFDCNGLAGTLTWQSNRGWAGLIPDPRPALGGVSVPFDSRLGVFGDSQLADGFASSGNTRQINGIGIQTWAQMQGLSGLYIPDAAQKAVIGERTDQILARLAAINAANCKVVLQNGGINNIISNDARGAQGIIDDRTAMAAGSNADLVIASTIPAPLAPSALTAPQEAVRVAANTGIRALASARVLVFDLDVLIGTSGATYYRADGLHFSMVGAYLLARQLNVLMATHVGTTSTFAALVAGADYGVNKTMTGTGGTLGGGATGVVANNTDLSAGNAGGATVVGSKDGTTGAQVITLSGTYTGNGKGVTLQQYFAATPANGDIVEGLVQLKVGTAFTAGVIRSIECYCIINDAVFGALSTGVNFIGNSIGGTAETSPLVVADGVVNIHIPPTPIPAGNAPAYVQLFITIQFKDQAGSQAIAGALHVSGMAARKVAA